MLMAMLDNCSECREVLKQNFQNYFIVGILLTCFPVLGHRSEYCSIYSSESFKTPLINIEWLERGQGNSSHSGGESNSTVLCSDCNTYRAWLSIFSIDFHHHLFYQLLDAPACLTGSWKHYRAKLPAESDGSFSQGNSGISALRMENPQGSFQKYYLLMHSCAFWCLSRGKMSNNQQNSYLLLVVLWSESQSRGQQQQHFIWLHRMCFCQECPICKICGWSEDTNRRVMGQNNKVDTRRYCWKI